MPQADDDSYVMFFRLDGTFTYEDGSTLDLTGVNALERPPDAVIADENVFAVLMDAVRCCSLGQITDALFEVGGKYRRSM